MTDGEPLKSLVDNDLPLNEIRRAQYRYKHPDPKVSAYIIATFTMQFDENDNQLESIAEWSLILGDHNDKDDNTTIIEDQITLVSEFDKMVENWESQGYETVICK